jgi:hypothetical protein
MTSHTDLARAMYDAYASSDRDAIEPIIGPGFHFWSPLDDGIDRAAYFERCWANHAAIDDIELLRCSDISATEVLATYVLHKADGGRAQNSEIITFDGDQATNVEVYFGWDLSTA